jgi:hypothetical protein
MEFHLCFFTETPDQKKVAVNPLLIRHLREISEAKVAIVFDSDHQIVVEGTVASIAEDLRKSTW